MKNAIILEFNNGELELVLPNQIETLYSPQGYYREDGSCYLYGGEHDLESENFIVYDEEGNKMTLGEVADYSEDCQIGNFGNYSYRPLGDSNPHIYKIHKIQVGNSLIGNSLIKKHFIELDNDYALCEDGRIYQIHLGGEEQLLIDIGDGFINEAYENVDDDEVIYNYAEDDYDIEEEKYETLLELLEGL